MNLFRIFTENGTAYSPRDFTHLDRTGIFSPGASDGAKLAFSVVISDDEVVENTESFYVQLAEIDPALQVINPNRSTVLIQDNDGKWYMNVIFKVMRSGTKLLLY